MTGVFVRHPGSACLWLGDRWDPPLAVHGRHYVEHVRKPVEAHHVVAEERVVGQTAPSRGAMVLRSEFSHLSVEELLGRASKMGYVEKPYPNGGVRKMRVINFLKARTKK